MGEAQRESTCFACIQPLAVCLRSYGPERNLYSYVLSFPPQKLPLFSLTSIRQSPSVLGVSFPTLGSFHKKRNWLPKQLAVIMTAITP